MSALNRVASSSLNQASFYEATPETKENTSLVSLFAGAGGLDIGFHKAGFETIWANDFDKVIAPSYKNYFPNVNFDDRSITQIPNCDIPKTEGIIGGPPCQSWSEAGAKRGVKDPRGKLFFEYIRVLKYIQPKFFVAENVSGILHNRNKKAFNAIVTLFEEAGYDVSWKQLNASDYDVPQDRKRVFVVGFRKDLNIKFEYPKARKNKKTLKDAIYDLKNQPLGKNAPIQNHEITDTGYSPMFMSRNRVRAWDEQSYTVVAMDRQTPLHPQAPKMLSTNEKDKKIFVPGLEDKYRRFSVRECARIQTFPDNYEFLYSHPRNGYKMVGNAVPVNLAFALARQIKKHLDLAS